MGTSPSSPFSSSSFLFLLIPPRFLHYLLIIFLPLSLFSVLIFISFSFPLFLCLSSLPRSFTFVPFPTFTKLDKLYLSPVLWALFLSLYLSFVSLPFLLFCSL